MYVCLCTGATSQAVADAVARGAASSADVARMCGAGSDCGRCRRSLRAIIATVDPSSGAGEPALDYGLL
jgi:bacterioferritin-associated ferredoxin